MCSKSISSVCVLCRQLVNVCVGRSVARRIVLPYKAIVTWWTCDSIFFMRQCSLDLEAVEPRFKTISITAKKFFLGIT